MGYTEIEQPFIDRAMYICTVYITYSTVQGVIESSGFSRIGGENAFWSPGLINCKCDRQDNVLFLGL